MSEDKKVPKLRFNSDEHFKPVTLDEICNFSSGKGISKKNLSNVGTPCIRYGELYTTYDEVIGEVCCKTNINTNDLVLSSKNDIILPRSGETAIDLANASCILKEGIAIGGDISILKTNQNGIYMSYYLNFRRNDIAKYAQGISIIHLYPKDFKRIKLFIPSIKEQDKIASFLIKINDKINILNKNLDSFLKFKKYLLQNLFPKSGELAPKLRFKKYTDIWVEKKLKEFVEIQGGYAFKSKLFNEKGIGNKVIRIGEIEKIIQLDNFNGKYSRETPNDKYKVYDGDFVIALSGDVGKNGIILGNGCAFINQRVGFFRNICANKDFIRYLINSDEFKIYLKRLSTSTAQSNMSNMDVLNYKAKIPSFDEQKIIGDFLKCVDKKIYLIENQIEKTKEFKKGLLQQMFV